MAVACIGNVGISETPPLKYDDITDEYGINAQSGVDGVDVQSYAATLEPLQLLMLRAVDNITGRWSLSVVVESTSDPLDDAADDVEQFITDTEDIVLTCKSIQFVFVSSCSFHLIDDVKQYFVLNESLSCMKWSWWAECFTHLITNVSSLVDLLRRIKCKENQVTW